MGRNVYLVDNILEIVVRSPAASVRRICDRVCAKRMQMRRTLHDASLYPLHV
jgi:hypothetical protein